MERLTVHRTTLRSHLARLSRQHKVGVVFNISPYGAPNSVMPSDQLDLQFMLPQGLIERFCASELANNRNKGLYVDTALQFVPCENVRAFAAAAPNADHYLCVASEKDTGICDIVAHRLGLILDSAAKYDLDTLIIGSFGMDINGITAEVLHSAVLQAVAKNLAIVTKESDTMSEQSQTSTWEAIQNSFCQLPSSKGMTYGQHLLDTLWADAHVFTAGVGMFIHAFFPMVLGNTEQHLRDYLHSRQV